MKTLPKRPGAQPAPEPERSGWNDGLFAWRHGVPAWGQPGLG